MMQKDHAYGWISISWRLKKKYGENILLKVSDRKPKATAPKRKGGIEKRKSSKGVICREKWFDTPQFSD
jgi:hypothetical protein